MGSSNSIMKYTESLKI